MFLVCVAAVRIPNIVGENSYLPYVTEKEQLDSFLKQNEAAVVVYEPTRFLLDFLDFSVFRYGDKVGFATAHSALAPSTCNVFPCFVGYHESTEIPLEQPTWSPTSVALWCENVLKRGKFPLVFPEQVREQLAKKRVVVFGIGVDERPTDVPNTVPFYLAEESAFAGLQLNVTKGVWVFRPNDRLLLPYNGNFEEVATTPIMSIEEEYRTKKFFAGYVLSPENEVNSNTHANILLEVAKKYNDQITFVIAKITDFQETLRDAGMRKLTPPFFFILESNNITKDHRWFVYGDSANNQSFVDAFVGRVVAGQEEESIICSELPEQGPDNKFWELNARTIESAAIDKDTAAVIVVTAPWCGHCKVFKPVLNATAEISSVNNSNVKFYWIDGTLNQLPSIVPNFSGYPTMFMWPAGENYTNPLTYDGEREIMEILTWVNESSGVQNYQMPTWDEEKAQERIKELKQYS